MGTLLVLAFYSLGDQAHLDFCERCPHLGRNNVFHSIQYLFPPFDIETCSIFKSRTL